MSVERERRPAAAVAWCALAASVVMLAFMSRPLFTGLVPFTGDLLHFHYPLRDFYSRALASGQPFDWMPSLFSGLYIVGEGQLGGYHPLHWLLYRLLPLDRAFAIEVVAAYPFLFGGMLVFLRRWCARAPAAFGAMLFAFGGFTLSHGVHPNMVAVIAHLPWLLWAIDRTVNALDWRRRAGGAAAIGLLTGSQLLLGHPQALWLSVLTEVAYLVTLLVLRPAGRGTAWSVAAVAGGWLLGAMVGAVQLLATLDALSHSVRLGYDAAYAESFSLPPAHLLQLLGPYLIWERVLRWNEAPAANDEFAAYAGAVALVLAVWWVAGYWTRRRHRETTTVDRFGLGVAGFGLLGLWLASGSYGRLYHLQTLLPVIGRFRVPARFVMFSDLAVAILATLAMRELLRAPARFYLASRSAVWAPWAMVAASVAPAIGFAAWGNGAATPAAMLAIVAGPALFVIAAALVTLAMRGHHRAIVALVIAAACDQALYGLGGVVAWHDFISREDVVANVSKQRALHPPEAGRIAYAGFPNIYTLAGYRVLGGYVGLSPTRQLDYTSPRATRIAQVAYANERFVKSATQIPATPAGERWYAMPPPLSRARLVTHARVSLQPAVDLADIDVDDTALTTHPIALAGGPSGDATLVRDDPGNIEIATAAPAAQLLVVSESYDDGWQASVDGVSTAVERVNGDFLGCVVAAGRHQVTLTFRPRHLVAGRWISLTGCAFALALLGASHRRGSSGV